MCIKVVFLYRPAICGKIFIAISIFFTYPLHFYVVGDVVTRVSEPYIKEKYQNIAQIFGRIAIVCFCGKPFVLKSIITW